MASFLNPHGTCPIDIRETAEAYVMKRLSTADALRFAIHCLTCRPCAAATEETESFVRAMKSAASPFKVDRPRLCSHATVTKVTTVRPGVVRAKMRFEVTQRMTRAPLPFMTASTSLREAMLVSPGVVMASAPCAAPYSTASCGVLPSRKP